MRSSEITTKIYDVESINEYREWGNKLPSFNFDKEWNVKIIPPFGCAIIRFSISYNNKWASVYFDAYSELGYMYNEITNEPIPYFEFYDGEDCHRYLIDESEEMMDDIRKHLNGEVE